MRLAFAFCTTLAANCTDRRNLPLLLAPFGPITLGPSCWPDPCFLLSEQRNRTRGRGRHEHHQPAPDEKLGQTGETPLARRVWRLAKSARHWSFPVIPPLHRLLYRLYLLGSNALATLTRTLWWTPLFQSRLTAPAPRLYLYGGIPYISGPVTIEIGADCRLSAAMTISGRASNQTPRLVIGRNVGIGWQTTPRWEAR